MKKILVVILLISGNFINAQQMVQLSQYMLNRLTYNPGVAGTGENNPLSLYVRQQWAGYSSAPSTRMLSYHGALGKSMGMGVQIYSDINGAFSNSGLTGSGAYRLSLSEDLKLSFGLSFTVTQNSIDGSDLIFIDASDEVLTNASASSMMPDAGFGTYLYHHDFYLGISALQLLQAKYPVANSITGDNSQAMHIYVSGGYKLMLASSLKFEPSVMMKMVEAAPMQLDLAGRLIYRENVWAGLSFRNNDALVAMVGMQRDRFVIGYAHDFTSSSLKSYSSGTNELFLQYGFKRKDKGATKI